jgi:hypothetical protein
MRCHAARPRYSSSSRKRTFELVLSSRFRLIAVATSLPLILLFGTGASPEVAAYMPRNDPGRIQSLVNKFRERLAIPEEVIVAIVPSNAHLISVEAAKGRTGVFLLSLEDGFLDTLSDDEIEAVIAHELGHVWIFTHHPYLQTERLANRIALRLVSRESLVKVYAKVWERKGDKGDMASFLEDADRRLPSIDTVALQTDATR